MSSRARLTTQDPANRAPGHRVGDPLITQRYVLIRLSVSFHLKQHQTWQGKYTDKHHHQFRRDGPQSFVSVLLSAIQTFKANIEHNILSTLKQATKLSGPGILLSFSLRRILVTSLDGLWIHMKMGKGKKNTEKGKREESQKASQART